MRPEFTDEQIQEQEAESFQDRLFNDGCALSWYLGHISGQELLERLAYLKSKAEANTVEQIERDAAECSSLHDLRYA